MDAPVLRPRALRARLVWALAALAAVACLTPTDPGAGRVAELRVRASFAPGTDPDAVGVTVDSATVIATPLDDNPAVVDTTVLLTDLDAVLSWIVEIDTDSAEHAVQLVLRGEGRPLYEGDAAVLLQRLPLGDAPIHDVPVAYVGPGAVATVSVTPGMVTLTAAGAVQQFAAEARDADGTPLDVTFTWGSEDVSVATIDSETGLASALATGVTTIGATARGVVGKATLTVAVGGLTVEISPTSATIPALNTTRQFTATARDGSGTVIADAEFAWATDDPAIATVDATGLALGLAEGAAVVTAETGGVTDTADLVVAVVTTIEVTPASATLVALDDTQPFTAVARDAGGAPIPDVAFQWTSSIPEIATVNPTTGIATAVTNGTTTIQATAGAASGSASLTVTQTVAAIAVTPETATLTALGATQMFTADARDANGNSVDATFAWSSSAASIATVDAATGLATAIATGEVAITAEADGLTASAQLVVAPGGLSVDVTPASATLTALGTMQQFTATARDGNGAVIGGATIAWVAREPGVVSVDTAGLATAIGEGTTWVVARLGTAADSAEVHVAVATTVEVTPAVTTLAAFGSVQQFTALARDAGGAVIPGATFAWSSADPAVATVGPATGLATAVANGTVSITARTGTATGTASLAVSQAIAGIAVTPADVFLAALGATQQFTALALDANGNAITRTVAFTWTSSDPAAATVEAASGLATAVANGTTGILAAAEGVTGGVILTVDQIVATVTVTPPSATLTLLADTQVFSAVGRDANGFIVTDATFEWTSGDPTIASIDPASGLATALGAGSTSIRATEVDGAFGTAQLLVTPEVATVELQPSLDTLRSFGDTRQFVAIARDAGGSVLTGVSFTWVSDDPTVATVDASGLATAVADGLTPITATAANGVSGTAMLEVLQTVASVEVTPATATLAALGATQPFTAVARDANGNPVAGASFAWTSGHPTVATIDPVTGVATAVANGSATIVATADSVSGSAALTVAQVVASVVVTPPEATLTAVGETVQFTAAARDLNGFLVSGMVFAWATSHDTVTTVNGNGLATAVANGTATISATGAGVTGATLVLVCIPAGTPPGASPSSTGCG